jgi:hypothetical protein
MEVFSESIRLSMELDLRDKRSQSADISGLRLAKRVPLRRIRIWLDELQPA